MKRILLPIALLPVAACAMQADRESEEHRDTGAALLAPPRPPRPEVFVDITAGAYHSCVLTSWGRVFCWGRTDLNASGVASSGFCYGGPNCATRPTRVQGLAAIAEVDAGWNHTCARTTTGQAVCWGSDEMGQVGEGGGALTSWPGFGPTFPDGTAGLSFKSISAGTASSCGATTSNEVYCWGQVVNSNGASTATPALNWFGGPVVGFDRVSVGHFHGCALDSGSGSMSCWGADTLGQTGVFGAPVAVPRTCFLPPCPPPPTITSVTSEQDFSCTDMSNGTVNCFGDNGRGQLGTLRVAVGLFSANPQPVGSGQLLQHVSVGSQHACALDPSGVAYCWGRGDSGQLGIGGSTVPPAPKIPDSRTPLQVNTTMTFVAIAAGAAHTCAIGTDGHIWCWGGNGLGQIGNGTPYYPGGLPVAQADATSPAQANEECIRASVANPPSYPCP